MATRAGFVLAVQLNDRPDISRDIDVYDVDLWFTTTAQMDTLDERGAHVICYFSAGSRENVATGRRSVPAGGGRQTGSGLEG